MTGGRGRQQVGAEDREAGYQPLATTVANFIRQEIVEGRLRPGERIRQDAVANACGTSRIPVREALNRLRDEGLVTLVAHAGARVATLDHRELDEIYLLRERLEPLALAESIPLLGTDDHTTLRRYIDEMERSADADDPSHWVDIDRRFHLTSYQAAPLPRFLELIDGFWNRTQQYRRLYTRLPESFHLAHLEHRLLMEAIERRDPHDGEAISRMHIRRTRLALDQHWAALDAGPASVG